MKITTLKLLFAVLLMASFFSCEKTEDPTPTNELMEGVWKLDKITDENAVDITDTVTSFFPVFLHMDDANSVNSTAGPLFMYLVYGKGNFINVSSKFDEIFKYTDIQLSEGEWFIDKNKVVDNFTLEFKMRFPTMETVNEVFQIFNIDPPEIVADAIDIIVYHKFKFVKVDVDDQDPDHMTWKVTSDVVANYYTKNQYGEPVVYIGISPTAFQKCTVTWSRQLKSINQLVEEAASIK
jgi:hypothetical protein